MNRITRIVIGIALALSSACNYLDVVPEDNATLDDAFKSQDKALSYLFSIYGHLPNNIQYWMPGQPCGGDDLAVAVKGTTRWFCYKSMVYGEESASTVYHNFMRHSGAPTGGVNYDYYSAIRYAYTFLDRIQQVPDISETNLREWQGEAWYLIGYFHWALLEYYGPIVIMDHEISLNADETELYKPRNTFDECVDFIVECFDKAIEMLPPRQQNIRWYGRASAAAAHGFKVRTLLFAASPLFNGNSEFYSRLRNSDGTYLVSQTYDPAKWERARIAAEQAISYAEQNGYRLYENPANASIADNFERGVRNFHDYFVEPEYNTDEYLCAYVHTEGPKKIQRLSGIRTELPYSADDFTTSYQVLFPAVEMYYTKNGLPLADDPTIDLTTLYDYDPDTQVANINQNRRTALLRLRGLQPRRIRDRQRGQAGAGLCRRGARLYTQKRRLDQLQRRVCQLVGLFPEKARTPHDGLRQDHEDLLLQKIRLSGHPPCGALSELCRSRFRIQRQAERPVARIPQQGPFPMRSARFRRVVATGRRHAYGQQAATGAAHGA